VYKARLDGIDFIKKQQWVVTNSVALIYAAIVWVGRNHKASFTATALVLVGGHHFCRVNRYGIA